MKTLPFGFVAVPLEITEELKAAMRKRLGHADFGQFWIELLNAAQVAVENRPAQVDNVVRVNAGAIAEIIPRRHSLLERCREAWNAGI